MKKFKQSPKKIFYTSLGAGLLVIGIILAIVSAATISKASQTGSSPNIILMIIAIVLIGAGVIILSIHLKGKAIKSNFKSIFRLTKPIELNTTDHIKVADKKPLEDIDESRFTICPMCQTKNSNTTKFCSSCGTNIKIVYCPKCNTKNMSYHRFCENCGHKLRNDIL